MAVDWGTIAELATAGGTLVLAISTFASVRSANRAARAAERSLMVGLQPLLVPSRLQDPDQKVFWIDSKHAVLAGGSGAAEVDGDAVYLAMSVRNAGNGIAVMRHWRVWPERLTGEQRPELSGSGGRPATCTSPPPTPASGRRRSVIRTTRNGAGWLRRSRPGNRLPWTCCTATTRAASG
jgi:hypothetical protein